MDDKLITIITPTYNRKKYLTRLYESLINQSNFNFKWWVVDDGSTDNTLELIKSFIEEKKIEIKYFRKINGGKNSAINLVLPQITTKLLLVVDSDDTIASNSIYQIEKDWKKYRKLNIGSLIYQRNDSNNEPMKKISQIFQGYRYYALIRQHAYGDYSDVFVTNALQEYRFPVIKNEKFISEGPLYYEFSQKYKSIFIPHTIIIGGYLKNGLTSNIRKLQIKNYNGTLFETNLYLKKDTPFYFRVKKAILFDYIIIGAKRPILKSIKKANSSILLFLLLPVGKILFLRDESRLKL